METNRTNDPQKQTWNQPEIKKLPSAHTLNQTGLGTDFEQQGTSGDVVPPPSP